MRTIVLTAAEEKLAELIWKTAPLSSPDLVLLTQTEMDWKKSTTYTVLKKLCEKGICQNDNAMIRVLLTKEGLIAHQSRRYVEDTFGGSLPKFVTSFMGGKKLSPEQAMELRQLIDAYEGEDANG